MLEVYVLMPGKTIKLQMQAMAQCKDTTAIPAWPWQGRPGEHRSRVWSHNEHVHSST